MGAKVGIKSKLFRRKEDTLSNVAIRRSAACAAVCFIVPALLVAQRATPAQVETFTGTTINLTPGSGESLRINVFKWATDAERDTVLAAWGKGVDGLSAVLDKAPTVGHIWDSGPIGYSVRYAQKLQLPDRSERIILITDRPLGSWGRQAWKPSKESTAPAYKFTLVELRLNKDGRGEGKMSLGAAVAPDTKAGTLALENYTAAPILVTNVRRVSSGA